MGLGFLTFLVVVIVFVVVCNLIVSVNNEAKLSAMLSALKDVPPVLSTINTTLATQFQMLSAVRDSNVSLARQVDHVLDLQDTLVDKLDNQNADVRATAVVCRDVLVVFRELTKLAQIIRNEQNDQKAPATALTTTPKFNPPLKGIVLPKPLRVKSAGKAGARKSTKK